MFRVE